MKINILQRFTLISIGVVLVIGIGLGLLVSNLLTTAMLTTEGDLTADFVRLLAVLPREAFEEAVVTGHYERFDAIWREISRIPGVYRLKIHSVDGKIVWANDPKFVGLASRQNEELHAAMKGVIAVERREENESHIVGEPVPAGGMVQVYVPMVSDEDRTVYGVLEIHRETKAFLAMQKLLLRSVWISVLGGGLLLFFCLFSVFRGALHEQLRLQAIERQYTQVEAELGVAATLQAELLPAELPEVEGIDLAAFHEASRTVGGDYYDAFQADDGGLTLAVADGAGKAIASSLLMTQTRSLVRAHATTGVGVKAMVTTVNQTMAESTHAEGFVTLFLAQYNADSKILTHCSAGHLPALLVRDDKMIPLEEGGLPLAVDETAEYVEGRTRLTSGDVLFMFTDGVTEALDADEEVFGQKRLCRELQNISRQPAAQIVEAIVASVRAYGAGETLSDDLTVLCMKMQ